MVEYKEIPVDDYGCVYGIIDLNNKSTDGRTGSVSKIMINITENDNLIFETEQYWIKDINGSVVLNDNGEKMLFDTDDQAIIYVTKNKRSKYQMIMDKMKKIGFNGLNEIEKEIVKKHNKKCKDPEISGL